MYSCGGRKWIISLQRIFTTLRCFFSIFVLKLFSAYWQVLSCLLRDPVLRVGPCAAAGRFFMKYLIIGAGGTGGVLGYNMSRAGLDVALLARGPHLRAMWGQGLILEKMWKGSCENVPVRAYDEEHYYEDPDVIFVCVKSYSLKEVIPFIRRIAKPETVVIPLCNVFGTGGMLQTKLPKLAVMDGCIYVSANIKSPGWILQHSEILRVYFGPRKGEREPELRQIADDLNYAGIETHLSENIERDCLEKFSYVSPIGAAGIYYDVSAYAFQRPGEPRTMFKTMIREIMALSYEMGFPFEKDYVEVNLDILKNQPGDATTSMQRDIKAGGPSEIDGLVYDVVKMARKFHVYMPAYEMVAEGLRKRGLGEKQI